MYKQWLKYYLFQEKFKQQTNETQSLLKYEEKIIIQKQVHKMCEW